MMDTCTFCWGSLAVNHVRFGFFVSQCENCEQETNGFLSLADMIEQAESLIER